MSTIVQPRREAASYVSTHAGAVGEIVVDTTNQRATVHDGSTLGGFPQASIRDLTGRNLGLNTNGAINQRGVSGTVTLASGVYGHDRYKGGANGCTYTFGGANAIDTLFSISAGSLIQAVDANNIYSSSMWVTWTGTAPVRVWQGSSASGTFTTGTQMVIDGVTVQALLVTGLTIGAVANVEFGGGVFNSTRPWQIEAALPNTGPTKYERRPDGLELILCQRFYFAIQVPGGVDYFLPIISNSTAMANTFDLPVLMRATPTVVVTGGATAAFASGNPFVNAASPFHLYLRGDVATLGTIAWVTSITASAEI